jgi:hypothetical protein
LSTILEILRDSDNSSIIKTLSLRSSLLEGGGIHDLAEALRDNQSIKKLTFIVEDPHTGGAEVKELVQILNTMTKLEMLTFSGRGVGDEGAVALATALTVGHLLQNYIFKTIG